MRYISMLVLGLWVNLSVCPVQAQSPNFAQGSSVGIKTVKRALKQVKQVLVTRDEAGDSIMASTPIRLNQTTYGKIGAPGDVDIYSFNLVQYGVVHIQGAGQNAACELRNVNGDGVNPSDSNDCEILEVLPAGQYFLAVSSSQPNQTGPYALSVDFSTDLKSFDDYGDTPANAQLITVGNSKAMNGALPADLIEGQLEFSGDIDSFTFALLKKSSLLVTTLGPTNTFCVLRDVTGAVLSFNNDGGYGQNCSITKVLPIGHYTVSVMHNYKQGTGTYFLHVGTQN